jgi:hypothetical protein
MLDSELEIGLLLSGGLLWLMTRLFWTRRPATLNDTKVCYLGIPLAAQHPNTWGFKLDGRVAFNYEVVSPVRRVSKDEYEEDLRLAKILFPELREGILYYATEERDPSQSERQLGNSSVCLVRKAFCG